MGIATETPESRAERAPRGPFASQSLLVPALIVVVGIFASTLPQPQTLGAIPLRNLLKNELHKSPDDIAGFMFLIGLFWYIKPLAGVLTDAFPVMGTRRRHYLLFSAVLACASWLLIGVLPHTYNTLLVGCIVLGLFMVMMSTVTGALLVEIGQSRGATGRLTAVRQFTQNACQLVTGPLGGLLASGAFMFVAGVNALFVVSIFPVAYYLLREPRSIAAPAVDSFAAAGRQLRSMAASWPFWFAIVFIGLFYFAPGIGTVSFFREQNVMHLSTRQQGLLVSIYGLGGIVAAVVYGLAVRRVRIRPLLLVGIVAASVATVGFLWYNDLPSALALQLVNGLCFGFAEVALIDLAARATPAGCEGLGYSCILSMRNLSLFGADKIGAHLSDAFHLGWGTMVWLNAATTAVVLVLLPLMPRKLMGSRDQPVAS